MRRVRFAVAVAAGITVASAHASLYYVDPSRSFVTLSGSATLSGVSGTWNASVGGVLVDSGGFTATGAGTLVQQGPGSLTTTLGGTVDASEAGGTLTVNGAAVTPNLNGAWPPDGSNDASSTAAAQLAGQVDPSVDIQFGGGIVAELLDVLLPFLQPSLQQTVYGAARSLGFDLAGSAAIGGGGAFDTGGLTGTWTSGAVNVGGGVAGTWSLTGLSGLVGSATGTFDAILGTIVVPFDFTFSESFPLAGIGGSFSGSGFDGTATVTDGTIDVTARYAGRIVAALQPPGATVPEPATIVLCALGVAVMVSLRRWMRAA